MKKVVIFFLVALVSSSVWAQPLPLKLKHTVIIDTDGAIDDMRAISLLLGRPEINIEAILLSDGSLSPDEGAEKVVSLLHEFNYDSIPVACGEVLRDVNPPWRQFNMMINWGDETNRLVTHSDAVGSDQPEKGISGKSRCRYQRRYFKIRIDGRRLLETNPA